MPFINNNSNEKNKTSLNVVEGDRNSFTYLIQNINSDLIKFKVKSDTAIGIGIQNEVIRLKERVSNLEKLLNLIKNQDITKSY